jgi:peptidoglycan L-alanyl-D-glutamate endopeptidase CwlK
MPRFSQLSAQRLSTCHQDLQTLFNEVIKYFDCTVTEGHRGREAQEAAFRAGASTKHFPDGNHNSIPSRAVDVYPHPIDLKNTNRFYWFAGYVMGTAKQLKLAGQIQCEIRCGADWDGDKDINDQRLNNLVHFEVIEPK